VEREAGGAGGKSAYERLGLAFTILYTTKGAPLVYYGDEIGLAGAGDPDNRRPMQWSNYNAGQAFLLQHLKDLGAIRAGHSALRRGAARPERGGRHLRVRDEGRDGDGVRGDQPRRRGGGGGGVPAGSYLDELGGGMVEGGDVSVPARSARILVKP
jgi:hypothetical protein